MNHSWNPLRLLAFLAIFAVLPPAAAERTIEDLSDQIYEATISIHKEIVASNASIHKEIAASNASIREEITATNASIVVLETKGVYLSAIIAIVATMAGVSLVLFGARTLTFLSSLTKDISTVLRQTFQLFGFPPPRTPKP